MAAILNSVILNLAILDSAILVFPLKLTHTCQDWFPPFAQKTSLIHSDSTWRWQPTEILSCWIHPFCQKKPSLFHSHSTWWWQPSWILPFWLPPFSTKKTTHSFWLNLMMAAILNSIMLDSDTAILHWDSLLSSLRFTQKHSHSTLTLTQTNSIWLKLIHSHLTWWRQPPLILTSWIWPSWIQPS